MSELLTDSKHIINLGGNEYEIAPVNLNILSALETELGCGLDRLGEQINNAQATTLRSLVWVLLKDKYNLTKDQVGEMIDLKNIAFVIEQISNVISGG